jgi:hypothetical protein
MIETPGKPGLIGSSYTAAIFTDRRSERAQVDMVAMDTVLEPSPACAFYCCDRGRPPVSAPTDAHSAGGCGSPLSASVGCSGGTTKMAAACGLSPASAARCALQAPNPPRKASAAPDCRDDRDGAGAHDRHPHGRRGLSDPSRRERARSTSALAADGNRRGAPLPVRRIGRAWASVRAIFPPECDESDARRSGKSIATTGAA